jgi:hypothetical protein
MEAGWYGDCRGSAIIPGQVLFMFHSGAGSSVQYSPQPCTVVCLTDNIFKVQRRPVPVDSFADPNTACGRCGIRIRILNTACWFFVK